MIRIGALLSVVLMGACAADADPTIDIEANDASAPLGRPVTVDAGVAAERDGGTTSSGPSSTHDGGAVDAGPVGTSLAPLNDSGGMEVGAGLDGGPADASSEASKLAGPDPLNASARCTSNATWSGVVGQTMRPGESCPTCHGNFELAGTLYPTGHEPNDCDGVNGITLGATVVVTDATGQVFTLFPNQVGNFYTSVQVTPPFHAKVVVNGVERAMQAAQTSGACNGCHTQAGANGAPGRITLPE